MEHSTYNQYIYCWIYNLHIDFHNNFFDFSEFIILWHVYNILSYFILIVFIVITRRIMCNINMLKRVLHREISFGI